MTEPHRRRRRTAGRRRRWILAATAAVLLLLVAAGAALAAFRYLPALDDARTLRTDLERMVDRARDAGLGLDRPTLVALRADAAAARETYTSLDSRPRMTPSRAWTPSPSRAARCWTPLMPASPSRTGT